MKCNDDARREIIDDPSKRLLLKSRQRLQAKFDDQQEWPFQNIYCDNNYIKRRFWPSTSNFHLMSCAADVREAFECVKSIQCTVIIGAKRNIMSDVKISFYLGTLRFAGFSFEVYEEHGCMRKSCILQNPATRVETCHDKKLTSTRRCFVVV